jgi:hypothetical protein
MLFGKKRIFLSLVTHEIALKDKERVDEVPPPL